MYPNPAEIELINMKVKAHLNVCVAINTDNKELLEENIELYLETLDHPSENVFCFYLFALKHGMENVFGILAERVRLLPSNVRFALLSKKVHRSEAVEEWYLHNDATNEDNRAINRIVKNGDVSDLELVLSGLSENQVASLLKSETDPALNVAMDKYKFDVLKYLLARVSIEDQIILLCARYEHPDTLLKALDVNGLSVDIVKDYSPDQLRRLIDQVDEPRTTSMKARTYKQLARGEHFVPREWYIKKIQDQFQSVLGNVDFCLKGYQGQRPLQISNKNDPEQARRHSIYQQVVREWLLTWNISDMRNGHWKKPGYVYRCLVIEGPGSIVRAALHFTINLKDRECKINFLETDEEYQNKRYGTILLYAAILVSLHYHCTSFELLPLDDTIVFYRKLGFEHNGTFCEGTQFASLDLHNEHAVNTLLNKLSTLNPHLVDYFRVLINRINHQEDSPQRMLHSFMRFCETRAMGESELSANNDDDNDVQASKKMRRAE